MPAPHAQPSSNGGFRTEELGRRQFQKAVATAVTAQGIGLAETQQKLQLNSEFMADMSQRIDEHSKDFDAVRANYADICIAFSEFRHLTFLRRLRWLFLGQ